jgi:hypothetical protein
MDGISLYLFVRFATGKKEDRRRGKNGGIS